MAAKSNPYALRNWLINEKDNVEIQRDLLNRKLGKYAKKRVDIICRLKFVNKKIKEIEDKRE